MEGGKDCGRNIVTFQTCTYIVDFANIVSKMQHSNRNPHLSPSLAMQRYQIHPFSGALSNGAQHRSDQPWGRTYTKRSAACTNQWCSGAASHRLAASLRLATGHAQAQPTLLVFFDASWLVRVLDLFDLLFVDDELAVGETLCPH